MKFLKLKNKNKFKEKIDLRIFSKISEENLCMKFLKFKKKINLRKKLI